jgi:hypothetical protein
MKIQACKQGFVKLGLSIAFYTFLNGKFTSPEILDLLRKYPLGTSMVIPGCNDGSTNMRGGIGGVCDRDGMCRGHI